MTLECVLNHLMKCHYLRSLISFRPQASSVGWVNNGTSIFQMGIHTIIMSK